MGYIYQIRKKNTVIPLYIGQTIKTPEERWIEHRNCALREKSKNSYAIHDLMRENNVQNFELVSIEEVDNSLLSKRERFWIKELHTHISERGYNLTWGGETCSENLKIPCYQYDLQGNYLQEFESISYASRYVNGSHTNLIKAIQGKINQAYGFRWSLQKLENLPPINSNYTGSSKIIYQYDLFGNYINQFPSSREAARALGGSQGNISLAANGKRKTAYGYIWSYKKI